MLRSDPNIFENLVKVQEQVIFGMPRGPWSLIFYHAVGSVADARLITARPEGSLISLAFLVPFLAMKKGTKK